jgi:hypothetical protein
MADKVASPVTSRDTLMMLSMSPHPSESAHIVHSSPAVSQVDLAATREYSFVLEALALFFDARPWMDDPLKTSLTFGSAYHAISARSRA